MRINLSKGTKDKLPGVEHVKETKKAWIQRSERLNPATSHQLTARAVREGKRHGPACPAAKKNANPKKKNTSEKRIQATRAVLVAKNRAKWGGRPSAGELSSELVRSDVERASGRKHG